MRWMPGCPVSNGFNRKNGKPGLPFFLRVFRSRVFRIFVLDVVTLFKDDSPTVNDGIRRLG